MIDLGSIAGLHARDHGLHAMKSAGGGCGRRMGISEETYHLWKKPYANVALLEVPPGSLPARHFEAATEFSQLLKTCLASTLSPRPHRL